MNKHLQHILEILQQENLTTEQKSAALKSLRDADKDFEITSFKLDRTEKVKQTTAILLEETIAELEQKRKAVEAQNRELEIEASLEKIRSRSLAMHKSDELKEVVIVVFKKLKELGLRFDVAGIQLYVSDSRDIAQWVAAPDLLTSPVLVKLPYSEKDFVESQIIRDVWSAKEQGKSFHNNHYSLEEKNLFFLYAARHNDMDTIPADVREFQMLAPGYTQSLVAELNSALWVDSYSNQTISADEYTVLERCARVFEQAYIRFLDLQKAEAQAREAQIEVALERVRSRSMAMHNSSELAEVATLLFEQVKQLGIDTYTSGFNIWDAEHKNLISWMSNPRGVLNPPFEMPIHTYDQHKRIYELWKNKEMFIEDDLTGEALGKHYQFLRSFPLLDEAFSKSEKAGIKTPERQVHNNAYFSNGYLLFITSQPYQKAHDIFKRFAIVFDQTYTRFLDLQKAEAQAREAQIEAALEKVRSTSLAMHDSHDLSKVVYVVFTELVKLDAQLDRCLILTVNPETFGITWYLAGKEGLLSENGFLVQDNPYPSHKAYLDGWRTKRKKWRYLLEGKEKKSTDAFLFSQTQLASLPDFIKADMAAVASIHLTISSDDFGCLIASSISPLSEAHSGIVERFTSVFNQAYTRFLDLQKAEAQAREAQIEAALERIRSSAMAMHSSEGILDVTQVLREQIAMLGEKELESILVHIYHEDKDQFEAWYSYRHPENTEKQIRNGKQMLSWSHTARARKDKEKYHEEASDYTLVADYKMLKEWYEYLLEVIPEVVELDAEGKPLVPDVLYYNYSKISGGTLLLITNSEASDHSKYLLRRAAIVFNLAYSRFLDLQKAEAQAREAQIETALERVRARTMAMQHSSELSETSFLLVKQVLGLGIKTWGCAFHIFDEDQPSSTEWFSNEQGYKSMYKTPREGVFLRYYEAAQRGESLHVEEFKGDACIEHYRYLSTLPGLEEEMKIYAEQGVPLPTSQFDNAAFFKYGYLMFVTYEDVPEAHDIFIRFAKVFEQTYTRFLDLQKAEAQARESQIQLALERVRAKTMAMQSSNDLLGVANVLREQMGILGQPELESSIVHLYNDTSPMLEAWYAFRPPNLSSREIITGVGIVPKECSAWSREVIAKYNSPETEYTIVASGEKLIEWYKVLEQYAKATVDYDENGQLVVPEVLHYHFSKFSGGALLMISNQEPSAEARELQRRAAVVFDLAYTRFLDLKKAEAQAREAKIEAALEKVRSRSLAMHNSNELSELVATLFDELIKLDLVLARCIIWILNDDRSAQLWMANSENKQATSYHINGIEHNYYNAIFKGWQERNEHWVYELKGAEKKSIDNILLFETELRQLPEEVKRGILSTTQTYVAGAFNKFGLIEASGPLHHTEEQLQILHRFNKVFEQSYTRFLDLQKAEAQAREAQIEAGLERVRSRSMGMQKSEDLREVVKVLYAQLRELGFQKGLAAINIMDHNSGDTDSWSEGFDDGYDLPEKYHVPYSELPGHRELIMHWKNGTPYAEVEISGQDKKSFDNYYFFHTDFVRVPEPTKQLMMQPEAILFSMAYMQYGALTWAPSPITDEQSKILQRFAKVFEQTYTRFLDLQKAEAQAREAQIEASLERVRGKAMAMHSSEDLTATISAFYHELEVFSITPRRCGVGLLDKETHMAELSTMNTTEQGESIEIVGRIKMTGHPVLEGVFDNWLEQKEYHPVLRGNEISEYYQLIRPQVAFPEYRNDAVQYGYFFFFTEGGVYAWTEKPLSEDELKIYRRFTTVLSLTYKRYKDLKDAETREQEAIKQAALDRVRADIASMRTTADLDRITPLIWKELTTLGIPFIRCGVFIMDESENKVHTYLSTPEGKAIAAYHTPMDDSGSLAGAIDHWRKQKVFVTHWVESDFQTQAEVLLKQGSITSRDQYLSTLPQGGFHLHFLPFRQGMLYVGSHESLPAEVVQLVQSLADAFSVAYARYEDFTRLESAKAQIEKTLTDLKQTQTQLIQSEKMASLGELTAGIAHEIQNPLNFVNNFSEVSKELLDEMKEELDKGNPEEAKALAADIIQNLEKINFHGKRADGIVKSMLQHSRKSTNQKELTDMNALCDEYLRLSYHGLRAKDKSFNAKFEIHCDPELPHLNVLPQDVGRVILNLINNAFYAVSERQKLLAASHQPANYEPTVSVSTKKEGDKVLISVKDNGTGIPAKVKEKIFQPFFTTKPTGQGTGLGLSLSYDIITKGHGGEIKMETKEGEGTEFTIVLPIL